MGFSVQIQKDSFKTCVFMYVLVYIYVGVYIHTFICTYTHILYTTDVHVTYIYICKYINFDKVIDVHGKKEKSIKGHTVKTKQVCLYLVPFWKHPLLTCPVFFQR